MSLYIKKFGGSSVATPEKIFNIAKRILLEKKESDKIVLVVSAMGNTTDELIDLASKVSRETHGREMDVLLSTGEQVSIAMMAMAFISLGAKAISLTGEQAGILVDGIYGKSSICKINPKRVFEELEKENIVIVAGFQGINKTGDIATLGRGGSDATAVALASAMNADVCEIFTDVEGVYSADPRFVSNAIKMKEITNTEMLEMARLGAGVMQPRSVEIGLQYHIPIHVRSTFSENEGTIIKEICSINDDCYAIKGVTHDINIVKVSLKDLKEKFSVSDIVSILKENNILIDMLTKVETNKIIFTIKRTDLEDAKVLLYNLRENGYFKEITFDLDMAKISVVGKGISDSDCVFLKVINILDKNKIKVDITSQTNLSISSLISKKNVKNAVQLIHAEFFK